MLDERRAPLRRPVRQRPAAAVGERPSRHRRSCPGHPLSNVFMNGRLEMCGRGCLAEGMKV